MMNGVNQSLIAIKHLYNKVVFTNVGSLYSIRARERAKYASVLHTVQSRFDRLSAEGGRFN